MIEDLTAVEGGPESVAYHARAAAEEEEGEEEGEEAMQCTSSRERCVRASSRKRANRRHTMSR